MDPQRHLGTNDPIAFATAPQRQLPTRRSLAAPQRGQPHTTFRAHRRSLRTPSSSFRPRPFRAHPSWLRSSTLAAHPRSAPVAPRSLLTAHCSLVAAPLLPLGPSHRAPAVPWFHPPLACRSAHPFRAASFRTWPGPSAVARRTSLLSSAPCSPSPVAQHTRPARLVPHPPGPSAVARRTSLALVPPPARPRSSPSTLVGRAKVRPGFWLRATPGPSAVARRTSLLSSAPCTPRSFRPSPRTLLRQRAAGDVARTTRVALSHLRQRRPRPGPRAIIQEKICRICDIGRISTMGTPPPNANANANANANGERERESPNASR